MCRPWEDVLCKFTGNPSRPKALLKDVLPVRRRHFSIVLKIQYRDYLIDIKHEGGTVDGTDVTSERHLWSHHWPEQGMPLIVTTKLEQILGCIAYRTCHVRHGSSMRVLQGNRVKSKI